LEIIVATFHVAVKSNKKGSAGRMARYDLRVGKWSEKDDLVASAHGNLPSWALDDPLNFFDMSDRHERKNGAAARTYIIALPCELSVQANIDVAKKIALNIAEQRAWLLAIHKGRSQDTGTLNPHMHLLVSDRQPDIYDRTPEQYFSRANPANPEKGGCKKVTGGMTPHEMGAGLRRLREGVAVVQNDALRSAGVAARVDHRTLKEQGIDRAPTKHRGPRGRNGSSSD
jgi:hypothetical protein